MKGRDMGKKEWGGGWSQLISKGLTKFLHGIKSIKLLRGYKRFLQTISTILNGTDS